MKKYALIPDDSHKSFYGKAIVFETEEGDRYLKSYNTIVAKIDRELLFHRYWAGWSATTGRHLKAFAGINKKVWDRIPVEEMTIDDRLDFLNFSKF